MRTTVFAALFAGLVMPALPVFAAAGEFQFVAGEVRLVQGDGRERAAAKGAEINEGDTVITGKSGNAQLRMVDEGIVALRPDSMLKVEAYRYAGKEDGSEKGILALIKGGFRTLTGFIGRANKRAYLVRTPTATIGIRGTDHEPFFIPAEGWSGAPGADAGTYDKVNTGGTYVETAGGRIDLEINQIGFAALDPQAIPVRLPAMPAFMRATPPPQGRGEGRGMRENAAQDARRDAADARRADDRRAALLALRDDRPDIKSLKTADGNLSLTQVTANLHPAPTGTGIVGGDLSVNGVMGSGVGVVKPDELVVLLDAAGNPALIHQSDNDFQYLRGAASLVEHGSTVIMDGTTAVPVRWGIYAGGAIVDAQGARAVRYFHFAGAPDTPLVAPVNMTYNVVAGATSPIADTGAVGGSVSSVDIRLNGNSHLVKYELVLTDALGRTWSTHLVGPVSLSQFAGAGGAALSGLCSGGTCGSDLPLAIGAAAGGANSGGDGNGSGGSYATGLPIGPTGQGLLSSYTLRTIVGGHGVTGSLVARP